MTEKQILLQLAQGIIDYLDGRLHKEYLAKMLELALDKLKT